MKNLISLFISTLLFTSPSWALTLSEAKTQGLVGEQQNGLLGIVKTAPEVTALVSEINKKRKAAYSNIAKKNKLTDSQVADLAGEKAISKTPAGQYIKDKNGTWTKKQ